MLLFCCKARRKRIEYSRSREKHSTTSLVPPTHLSCSIRFPRALQRNRAQSRLFDGFQIWRFSMKKKANLKQLSLWRPPASSENSRFSPIPLYWTGFRPIGPGMAKNEFCNIQSILSDLSEPRYVWIKLFVSVIFSAPLVLDKCSKYGRR